MPKNRSKCKKNKKIWKDMERKNAFGAKDLTPFNVKRLISKDFAYK